MNKPNYRVVELNMHYMVIRDIGPHDKHMSVTNGAEEVVRELAEDLNGRRLFYYDSSGSLDELVIKDNEFSGFRSGGPLQPNPVEYWKI